MTVNNIVAPPVYPFAIAYLRLNADDVAAQIGNLLGAVAECCLSHRLRLVRTVTDYGYDGRRVDRPGIMELRQALSDTVGLTVVVPTLEHLSPAACVRRPLAMMIEHLGGALLVATGSEQAERAVGAASHGVQPCSDHPVGGRSS